MEFEIIASEALPKGEIFFIPKIPGLILVDGKLQVEERGNKGEIIYRDLNENEMRQFGHIKNISIDAKGDLA